MLSTALRDSRADGLDCMLRLTLTLPLPDAGDTLNHEGMPVMVHEQLELTSIVACVWFPPMVICDGTLRKSELLKKSSIPPSSPPPQAVYKERQANSIVNTLAKTLIFNMLTLLPILNQKFTVNPADAANPPCGRPHLSYTVE